MLCLTQRIGESVLIGEHGEIEVTILDIKGGQIRVGYTAPKDVPVHRRKIFERIQEERKR